MKEFVPLESRGESSLHKACLIDGDDTWWEQQQQQHRKHYYDEYDQEEEDEVDQLRQYWRSDAAGEWEWSRVHITTCRQAHTRRGIRMCEALPHIQTRLTVGWQSACLSFSLTENALNFILQKPPTSQSYFSFVYRDYWLYTHPCLSLCVYLFVSSVSPVLFIVCIEHLLMCSCVSAEYHHQHYSRSSQHVATLPLLAFNLVEQAEFSGETKN